MTLGRTPNFSVPHVLNCVTEIMTVSIYLKVLFIPAFLFFLTPELSFSLCAEGGVKGQKKAAPLLAIGRLIPAPLPPKMPQLCFCPGIPETWDLAETSPSTH